MRALPGFLLRDVVELDPLLGPGQYGPVERLRAHVQEGRKLVRSAGGVTAEAKLNVWLRPRAVPPPLGSRLRVRGQEATAVQVDVHDGRGIGTPDHIELWCELVEFLATTTVTVTRGDPGEDEFGDRVDSTTVVAAGLPASFIEDKQKRWTPVERRGGVVETFTVRLRSSARVLEGDRLTDAAGLVFQVAAVVYPPAAVGDELGEADVRLTVRRVAATSAPPDDA